MQHPSKTLSADVLPSAYDDLLTALARDEPDALRRAAATVQDQVGTAEQASPASQLARAWLAFAGDVDPTLPPDGTVFHFTFPAQIAFSVVAHGGVAAANRVARRALDPAYRKQMGNLGPISDQDPPRQLYISSV